jgi:hypothetical protein
VSTCEIPHQLGIGLSQFLPPERAGLLNYYNVFSSQWQYPFIWKTDRTWAGTCRQLIVQLNDGNAPPAANFKFVR